MVRQLSLAFCLLLALGISACNRTVRIMPLGDSITAGLTVNATGHHFQGGYRRHLEQLLEAQNANFNFVGSQKDPPSVKIHRPWHEGHCGWRIEDLDNHIGAWLKASHPDVILLLIGTNDIYQKRDLPRAPARFAALLNHIRAIEPRVWVLASSILPMGEPKQERQVEIYNSAIRAIVLKRMAEGERILWVDMNGESGVTQADLYDGLHPDRASYDRMAEVWFESLKALLHLSVRAQAPSRNG